MVTGKGIDGRPDVTGNSRSPNRTLEKGLLLLNLFDVDHPDWSLRELREESRFSKTTTLRLAKTLEALEYLACDPTTGRYHLGSSMMRHAYVGLSHSELARAAHPLLVQLAKETSETAGLTVWTNQGPLLVDLVLTSRMFKPHLWLGMLLPGRGGAAERIHLAFGPDSTREAVLSGPHKARTPFTLTDRKALREELERVRREGFCFELKEWDVSMGAVAAPVFGADGHIRSALAVVVPIERCGDEEMQTFTQAVVRTACVLSRELGYQSDPPGRSHRSP
jgi:IclR family KDG regulon transcriptional repressor